MADAKTRGYVLLIEDEELLLRSYAKVLRRAGFAVVELADGRGVEDTLATGGFDAVVTDLALPGIDGIEVLRRVRACDPDLPVILMTAGGDLDSALKAIEHGALRYLMKPIEPPTLVELVDEAVSLRRIAAVKRRAFELYGHAASDEGEREPLAPRFAAALVGLHMAYQPIVRWSERSVFAYEALARTDEATLCRPDRLFAAGEELGRLFDLGRAIRREVAATVGAHPARPTVFVNLHPHDLEDDDLLSPASPLRPISDRIVLELTERASLDRIGDVRARLTTLRRQGFRLAIDDLGAGYAGLSSFAQVQPEVVKLDMSLVRDVDREPTKQKLIRSMVELCGDLGIDVIAEGVETRAELEILVGLGCDLLQGYLFARPGPAFPTVAWDAAGG